MRHNTIILLAVSSTRYEREKLCRSINYTFPVKIIDFYLRNVPPPGGMRGGGSLVKYWDSPMDRILADGHVIT